MSILAPSTGIETSITQSFLLSFATCMFGARHVGHAEKPSSQNSRLPKNHYSPLDVFNDELSFAQLNTLKSVPSKFKRLLPSIPSHPNHENENTLRISSRVMMSNYHIENSVRNNSRTNLDNHIVENCIRMKSQLAYSLRQD